VTRQGRSGLRNDLESTADSLLTDPLKRRSLGKTLPSQEGLSETTPFPKNRNDPYFFGKNNRRTVSMRDAHARSLCSAWPSR